MPESVPTPDREDNRARLAELARDPNLPLEIREFLSECFDREDTGPFMFIRGADVEVTPGRESEVIPFSGTHGISWKGCTFHPPVDTGRCPLGPLPWKPCDDPACPVHGDLGDVERVRQAAARGELDHLTPIEGEGERVTALEIADRVDLGVFHHDTEFISLDQHKRELEAARAEQDERIMSKVEQAIADRSEQIARKLERQADEWENETDGGQREADAFRNAAQIARNAGGEVEGNG